MFAASTVVEIGNGQTTTFWTSSWVEGRTAQNIVPILFLKAKWKKLTLHKAIKDNHWIQHKMPIQTAHEINAFVSLWEVVRNITSDEDREDNIRWRRKMVNTRLRALTKFNSKVLIAN